MNRMKWSLCLALAWLCVCPVASWAADSLAWQKKTPDQWAAVLSAALEDGPESKRPAIRDQWYAAYALGEYGSEGLSPANVDVLLARFAKDLGQDDYVRAAVALTLGKSGDPRVVSVLTEALNSDYVAIRRSAANALGLLGKQAADAVPVLEKTVKEDKDATARSNAAVALWSIAQSPEALEYVRRTLAMEKALDIYHGASALVRMQGELPETDVTALAERLVVLTALAKIQEQDTARLCVDALVRLGKPAAETVRKAFQAETNDTAKARLLTVLVSVDESETLTEELLELASPKNDVPDVLRIAAIRGLRRAAPEKQEAVKALMVEWTKDTEAPRNVVHEATLILSQQGTKETE